eukprot:UN00026
MMIKKESFTLTGNNVDICLEKNQNICGSSKLIRRNLHD